MRAVRSENTKPELTVRKIAHSLGYRFRLHVRDLPGTPDIVFPRFRKVVLVHGCFWHGHKCVRGARIPKTNANYWKSKISQNIARDASHLKALQTLGWGVLVFWECEVKDHAFIATRLKQFLAAENV